MSYIKCKVADRSFKLDEQFFCIITGKCCKSFAREMEIIINNCLLEMEHQIISKLKS